SPRQSKRDRTAPEAAPTALVAPTRYGRARGRVARSGRAQLVHLSALLADFLDAGGRGTREGGARVRPHHEPRVEGKQPPAQDRGGHGGAGRPAEPRHGPLAGAGQEQRGGEDLEEPGAARG